MKSQVNLEKITKSYPDLNVIKSVDLKVSKGKIVCLIGPNGCGKSTLLKIISGIENKDSGRINRPRRIAYQPQQDSLLPWLTVRKNLELPGLINKKSHNKIDKYLHQFNLKKFEDFYPNQISGGMKQKVAIIRSVLYEPELIILDEPFSALDSITRMQMQVWFEDLWLETKPTVIFVTHDIREALQLADDMYVLSARPTSIIKHFSLPQKRPRSINLLKTDSFSSIEEELKETLFNETY